MTDQPDTLAEQVSRSAIRHMASYAGGFVCGIGGLLHQHQGAALAASAVLAGAAWGWSFIEKQKARRGPRFHS